MNMSKGRRRMLIVSKACLIILAFIFMIRCIVDPDYTKYGGIIAGFIIPFVPEILRYLFKAKISFRFEMLFYMFVLLALDFGICLDFYRTVPFFDKTVHTLSGVGTGLVGYYALKYFKADKTPRIFRAQFIMYFSMAIAVMWEFFEYFCDKFLGQNMQQLVSTGVDDTMTDLLVATIGSLVGGALIAQKKIQKYLES